MKSVLSLSSLLLLLLSPATAQYGGYGRQAASSSTAVSSPIDTIKLAIANRSPDQAKRFGGVDTDLVHRAQVLLDDGLTIDAEEVMDIEWAGVSA